MTAYVKSEYDASASTAVVRGRTFTKADGRWNAPLKLNAGVAYTIVEQQPRLGGVIQTFTRDGCVVEGGPDRLDTARRALSGTALAHSPPRGRIALQARP